MPFPRIPLLHTSVLLALLLPGCDEEEPTDDAPNTSAGGTEATDSSVEESSDEGEVPTGSACTTTAVIEGAVELAIDPGPCSGNNLGDGTFALVFGTYADDSLVLTFNSGGAAANTPFDTEAQVRFDSQVDGSPVHWTFLTCAATITLDGLDDPFALTGTGSVDCTNAGPLEIQGEDGVDLSGEIAQISIAPFEFDYAFQ